MKRRKIINGLTYAALMVGFLLIVFPFYLTVVSSHVLLRDFKKAF